MVIPFRKTWFKNSASRNGFGAQQKSTANPFRHFFNLVPKKMYQDSHLHIGSFHTTHCEDSLIATSLTMDVKLLAVMDGCSSGTDCFFSATMAAKLLRKIANEIYHLDFREPVQMPLAVLLEKVLSQFWTELRSLVNQLQLSRNEMLFTLVVALVDIRKRNAEVVVVGDGYVGCNGTGQEFDQNNRPDYLGYHLAESFQEWWPQQKQRLQFTEVRDLSISTDGIFSFRQAEKGDFPAITEAEIVDKILHSPGKIKAKVAEIRSVHGLAPADDLGILRMVLEG